MMMMMMLFREAGGVFREGVGGQEAVELMRGGDSDGVGTEAGGGLDVWVGERALV